MSFKAKRQSILKKMSGKEALQIDIEKIISQKAPKFANKIPRFIFRYFKKLLHQDDINSLLVRANGLSGLPFVTETMKEFNTGIVTEGLDHIKKEGRYIVAANHPIGGLDGIALIDTVGKIRPDVITPVNDFLLFVPNLRPLFIPVNKLGSNADNIKIFNETFAGDRTICYYPFGLCSRKHKGKIIDLEWKKTFITKAKAYHRDIIPTHISGRNSDFFYNLSNIRKKLGIKANIEMAFLVNEFYKQKIRQVHIVGEYANLMVRDYNAALQFVQDYFQEDFRKFIAKYFKGDRIKEIDRNITPGKYHQLFDSFY